MTKKMTLAEKIALCDGKTCWETRTFPIRIPSMFMCDGPVACASRRNTTARWVNESRPATSFRRR